MVRLISGVICKSVSATQRKIVKMLTMQLSHSCIGLSFSALPTAEMFRLYNHDSIGTKDTKYQPV